MIIKKGTVLEVNHSRSGIWRGIALKKFDTDKDEWYPLALYQEDTVHGLSNTWEKGEEMPARRGLCTVKIISNNKPKRSKKQIGIDDFGKDHWSLLAYCEYRTTNHQGVLDRIHLRCKEPMMSHSEWKPEYGTRLSGYWGKNKKIEKINKTRLIGNHDDYDCLNDLETAGLLENLGTMVNPYAELTDMGRKVMMLLSKHKQKGEHFSGFVYKEQLCNLI